MVYIPRDIIDLIIDQLCLATSYPDSSLRATSLVSTAWVNPSQRHLFSSLYFYSSSSVRKWCSRIRPGPHGISRHVRALQLSSPSVVSGILEIALRHFTSFQNLRELDIMVDVMRQDRIEILAPIVSSFAGTLKRLEWTQRGAGHGSTWKTLYGFVDLLPNLTEINLSGFYNDPLILPSALPCIRLSPKYQLPDLLAFKHIKFQKLELIDPIPPSPRFLEYCQNHLRVLDFTGNDMKYDLWDPWGPSQHCENLHALFKACHVLQELSFPFWSYIGSIICSIPSDSVTLIRLHDPWGVLGTTYNSCWGIPLDHFESHLDDFKCEDLPEYEKLGVSIRKVAQRFSERHCGLKTRVQVIYRSAREETQAFKDGEIPFFMTKLEEELGTHVTLGLNLHLHPSDTEDFE